MTYWYVFLGKDESLDLPHFFVLFNTLQALLTLLIYIFIGQVLTSTDVLYTLMSLKLLALYVVLYCVSWTDKTTTVPSHGFALYNSHHIVTRLYFRAFITILQFIGFYCICLG